MVLFLEAFLLALASSTDNFMVGLSVGISDRHLSFGVNALISICNASGAWLAGIGGSALGENLPPYISPLLSAIIFGGLALREFLEFLQTIKKKRRLLEENEKHHSNEKHVEGGVAVSGVITNSNSSSGGTNLDMSRAMQLALPMTLNNLAGGVAGGAIGVSPLQAGLYGLLASFLTMALGHWIGLYLARLSNKSSTGSQQNYRASDFNNKRNSLFSQCHLLLDPSFASGALLGILCLISLQELLAA